MSLLERGQHYIRGHQSQGKMGLMSGNGRSQSASDSVMGRKGGQDRAMTQGSRPPRRERESERERERERICVQCPAVLGIVDLNKDLTDIDKSIHQCC